MMEVLDSIHILSVYLPNIAIFSPLTQTSFYNLGNIFIECILYIEYYSNFHASVFINLWLSTQVTFTLQVKHSVYLVLVVWEMEYRTSYMLRVSSILDLYTQFPISVA